MKKYIIILAFSTIFLTGCDKKEKEKLHSTIDSLNYALDESKKAELAMNEVGIVLDSIDANRHELHLKIVEGISYSDYINRLKEINIHIKNLNTKISKLEDAQKKSNTVSTATIHRLKKDLESKSREIVALQLDVETLRNQNTALTIINYNRDSTISSKNEMIKIKAANITLLEDQIVEISNKNQAKVASLYFDQAHALETAADRTKFAPRKKKETRREALELYKLSFSLGNEDAQAKILELEKKLS